MLAFFRAGSEHASGSGAVGRHHLDGGAVDEGAGEEIHDAIGKVHRGDDNDGAGCREGHPLKAGKEKRVFQDELFVDVEGMLDQLPTDLPGERAQCLVGEHQHGGRDVIGLHGIERGGGGREGDRADKLSDAGGRVVAPVDRAHFRGAPVLAYKGDAHGAARENGGHDGERAAIVRDRARWRRQQ